MNRYSSGLFFVLTLMPLWVGCQSSSRSTIDTQIDNVRAENKEMHAEETDGDLYEPIDYED